MTDIQDSICEPTTVSLCNIESWRKKLQINVQEYENTHKRERENQIGAAKSASLT